MTTYNHKTMSTAERHALPRYEFATLGAANAQVYSASDTSCAVRVGTGPYAHYTVDHVVAGVGTLTPMTGDVLPPFGTGAGEIAEGNHTHTGLGSGYIDVFCADAMPAVAHAQDDQCAAGAVDAKWTTVNPAGGTPVFSATANASKGRYDLSLQLTSGANGALAGLYQAVPDTECSIIAQIGRLDSPSGHTGLPVGLFVAAGVTLNDDSRFIGVEHTATESALVRTFTAAGYDVASVGSAAQFEISAKWLRIRLDGTTAWLEASGDGNTWYGAAQAGAGVALGFTPTHWGVACYVNASGTRIATGCVRNVQVLSGAGMSAADALMPGRMVRIPIP